MEIIVDDVGSYPLPIHVSRKTFRKAYTLARESIIKGKDIKKNDFLLNNFCKVVIDSFRQKMLAGLDVVNYPQHYDGIEQIRGPIQIAMKKGTFLVEQDRAFLPEVHLIKEEGKRLYQETGKKIALRVSIFGPMELYLKEVGTTPYYEVLQSFAETVKRFAKNSIVNQKYVKTEVISLDEPSFGILNVTADRETIRKVLDKAFDFQGATRQIHLHSTSRLPELLAVGNIDVLSFEYAASPKNIESVSRKMLEEADKEVRVGVSRTDIDSILAELYDRGITKPVAKQIVDKEEEIKKRYLSAMEKFGDRMRFSGPDCGLGSWPSQEAAQLLLKRTVRAIKNKSLETN